MKSLLEKGVVVKLLGDSITAGAGTSDDNRTGEIITMIDGEIFERQVGKKCWASLLASYMDTNYPNSALINSGLSGINSNVIFLS